MTKGYLSDTKTNGVGDYDITTSVNELKNYDVTMNTAKLHIEQAGLTIQIGNASTVYGTEFDKSQYRYTYKSGIKNGDTEATLDAALGGMKYTNDAALNGKDGKWTREAGDYDLKGKGVNNLTNHKVTYLNGKAKVIPYTLTEENIVNPDGKPLYTTKYGQTDPFGKATFTGVNGDGTLLLDITDSSALTGAADGRITKDVGDNIYDTTVSLEKLQNKLQNKNYQFADGATSKTFEKTASVTPADLTVKVGNVWTNYGEAFKPEEYYYSIRDAANGDSAADLKKELGKLDYVNKGVGTDGRATQDVGHYALEGTADQKLSNYTIHFENGDAEVKPYTITEKDIVNPDGKPLYTTKYGQKDPFRKVTFTGVNGDGTLLLDITDSSALTGAADGRITKDVGDNIYDTTVSLEKLQNKNYQFADGATSKTFEKTASVTPADLTVKVGNVWTNYGEAFKPEEYYYSIRDAANGDSAADLKKELGKLDYVNKGVGTDGRATQDVGHYALEGTADQKLSNYTIHFENGDAEVKPYTITEKDIVNPDGKPLYTTKYGQKDPFRKVTFTGVNGDGTLLLDITDSSALTGAADGRITKDVGDNIYDTTVSLKNLQNKNYQFARGATSKTFEKTASVTPAELTIKTKDVETEYGTVKTTTSEVEGLVNGDLPTGFIYDYGNYGGAYLDGNTKTNDVNTYHFGTTLSDAEFLKNYTITGGEADVKIDPKDVTFFVSGTGNTLNDITYTVDPDIDAQLAYGEHVDADYTPGNDLGSNQYGVVAHINGTPIVTGDVAGNYRYNYGGLITLSPTVSTKPDIDPHNPSNLDGSGSWTSNMGNRGIPGVERVAGLASAELPFFKVEAGQVSHYGTYDVAADPDKVRLEPTGKRLPEPNQPKTQYREYTKALTTTDGTGMFRMVYDGSTFNITPVDDGALALMRMGDVKNNVELSAEALHAGFSEMGILLEDLDGVYVHFDTMA